MSLDNIGQQGRNSEIAEKQIILKSESKKKRKKKQEKSQNKKINIYEITEQSKQKQKEKSKVKKKQRNNTQRKSKKDQKKKEKKKEKEKPNIHSQKQGQHSHKTQKRRNASKSKQLNKNNKEKKIKKNREIKSKRSLQPATEKHGISQGQLKNNKQQLQNQITTQHNQSSKAPSQVTEAMDEIKQEMDNFSDSEYANMHEIYMAQKLHAFREELEVMQIKHKQLRSNKSGQLKKHESAEDDDTPNDKEIDQLIHFLREKQPHINLEKTVEMLYRCLIKKDSKGNNCRTQQEEMIDNNEDDKSVNQKYSQMMKCVEGNLRALVDKSHKNIVKRYIKNPRFQERFQRDEDRAKYHEKQIVAKAFCEREYGMPALMQEIRESGTKIIIERNRYKSLVTCVITEGYRKLQDFLIDQCKRDIKPLNRQEIKTLHTTLLNCRSNFEDEECFTYIKFIKLAFEVQSVTITEEAAIKLYIGIQKALKIRIGELQLDRMYDTMRCNKEFKARRTFQNQKFQIHRIWNNEIEIEFLHFYKRNQEFAKIRDYFKTKHVQHQHLFTIDSLRSRFHKIMRMALRKTNCFCEKFGQERVPQMIKLNDVKVKNLLRSPDGLNARLLLVDMYLNDECDIKRLYQTVSAVNEFVIMKDNQRMNQMIEAQPLFNSAAEKIQHNVNISKNKIKAKSEASQDLYYKGKEMNYDHIVQIANGKNLHYYRKPAQHQLRDFREKEIKFEQRGSTVGKDGTMQTLVDELANNQKWLGSSCASRYGSVSEGSMKMSRQSFNKMIQEEVQKFNKKPGDNFWPYR